MSQYKLVMLPTQQASHLFISTVNDKLLFEEKNIENRPYAINQHLYLVDTKETVHKSDKWFEWFWNTNKNMISNDKKEIENYVCYKIISSTDSSVLLPNLQPEVVEQYVKNPNLEVDDVIFNVDKLVDGKWNNFANVNSYEKALGLVQTDFLTWIKVSIIWKNEKI